jgi:histidine phosphotransfer protein HptB
MTKLNESTPDLEGDIASKLPDKLQFDPDDLVERLMGDQTTARRVAEAFVESMPQQLAALATAVNSFDAKATMFAAHSIKGAAANVGVVAVRELASNLEKLGVSGDIATASGLLPELAATFQAVKPRIERFCKGGS